MPPFVQRFGTLGWLFGIVEEYRQPFSLERTVEWRDAAANTAGVSVGAAGIHIIMMY